MGRRALSAALGQRDEQFGKGAVLRMGDRTADPIDAIPTGSLMLDIALGIGVVTGLVFGLFPQADLAISRVFYEHVIGGNTFGWRIYPPLMIARDAGLWVGTILISGALLALDTASQSILGYEHDLDEPVPRRWNLVQPE